MKQFISKGVLCFLCLLLSLSITGCEDKKETAKMESVKDAFIEKGLAPNNWKFVSTYHEWGGETPNYSTIYFVYIDKDKYDAYRYYWLDGVEAVNGTNVELKDKGDHIFGAIYIFPLSYKKDVDYSGAKLKAYKQYYLN